MAASGSIEVRAGWANSDGVWSDSGGFAETATLATGGVAAAGTVVIAASDTTTIDLQALAGTAFGKAITTSFDYITGFALINSGTVNFSLETGAAANPWIECFAINIDWLLEPGDVIQFATDEAGVTAGYDVTAPAVKMHFVNAIASAGELTYAFVGY